jgi:intein-encoded DNA endonuclease-like protein
VGHKYRIELTDLKAAPGTVNMRISMLDSRFNRWVLKLTVSTTRRFAEELAQDLSAEVSWKE